MKQPTTIYPSTSTGAVEVPPQPPVSAPVPGTSGRRPVVTIDTYFPVRGAIWENRDSEGNVFYSLTVERAYKKNGQWNSSQSFGRSDVLELGKLAERADTVIRELLEQRREAGRQSGEAA